MQIDYVKLIISISIIILAFIIVRFTRYLITKKIDESAENLRAYVWPDDPFRSFDIHTDLNKSV